MDARPPLLGRGLATEGALASVGYGFEELGLERIISITLPENAASRRVMGKAGLTYRGRTRWRDHDVVWYAADRQEWAQAGLTERANFLELRKGEVRFLIWSHGVRR